MRIVYLPVTLAVGENLHLDALVVGFVQLCLLVSRTSCDKVLELALLYLFLRFLFACVNRDFVAAISTSLLLNLSSEHCFSLLQVFVELAGTSVAKEPPCRLVVF